jgi:hypothetical protein
MIFFGLLHWILSQSIFLVRVDFYDANNLQDQSSISTCGYSNIAIISAIVVGSLGVLVNLGIGFRRFRPGIPLAAGCSAVISASCHRPEEDENASLERVKWGVVSGSKSIVGEEPYWHCCITSLEVEEPVKGTLYA